MVVGREACELGGSLPSELLELREALRLFAYTEH